MADIATAATEASPFVAELESKNLHPLWDRYQRITPIKPQPQDAPFLWRWREVEPLLQRSVGEVSINDIERRALIRPSGRKRRPRARCSPPSPCSTPASAPARTVIPARRSVSPRARTVQSRSSTAGVAR
jgi:hypothetical protein